MTSLAQSARNGVLAGIIMGIATIIATVAAYTAFGIPRVALTGPGCIRNYIMVTIGTGIFGFFASYYPALLPGQTLGRKAMAGGTIFGFTLHLSTGISPLTRPLSKSLGWAPTEWMPLFNMWAFIIAGILTGLTMYYIFGMSDLEGEVVESPSPS